MTTPRILALAGEEVLEVGDPGLDLGELGLELLGLEAGQAGEAHVEDGLGLDLVEAEALHEALLGQLGILGCLDDLDDFVDVLEGDDEAAQDMGLFLGLAQLEAGAPGHDLDAVLHEVGDEVLEAQAAWACHRR